MARQSNVEQFTRAYVRKLKNAGSLRGERIYLDKALKMIQFFLERPCCTDPDADITYARRDNSLTNFIKANLINGWFDRRLHRRSLLRTEKVLQNILIDPCCNVLFSFGIEPTNTACFTTPSIIPVTFTNESTTEEKVYNISFNSSMATFTERIVPGSYSISVDGSQLSPTKLLRLYSDDTLVAAFSNTSITYQNIVIGDDTGQVNGLYAFCTT